MDIVNVGIIGLGKISYAHAYSFLANRKVRIVAICDIVPELLKNRAKEWDVKKLYSDYHEILKDEEVDLVDILNNHSSYFGKNFIRAEMAIAAAEAGKHVIVEKPMCRSIKEADMMIDAAKEAKVKLMMAESYVFHTPHVKTRELIDEGKIGEPMQVRINQGRWSPRPRPESPTALTQPPYLGMIDMGPHYFAMARYFMRDSDIAYVSSVASASGTIVAATWHYKGCEKIGTFARTENRTFTIYGAIRSVIFGTEGMIEVLGHDGGWRGSATLAPGQKVPPLTLWREGKTEIFRFEFPSEPVAVRENPEAEVSYFRDAFPNEINHFIECVAEDRKPRYSGEDGKKDLQCTLACIKSATDKKQVAIDEVPYDYAPFM